MRASVRDNRDVREEHLVFRMMEFTTGKLEGDRTRAEELFGFTKAMRGNMVGQRGSARLWKEFRSRWIKGNGTEVVDFAFRVRNRSDAFDCVLVCRPGFGFDEDKVTRRCGPLNKSRAQGRRIFRYVFRQQKSMAWLWSWDQESASFICFLDQRL